MFELLLTAGKQDWQRKCGPRVDYVCKARVLNLFFCRI